MVEVNSRQPAELEGTHNIDYRPGTAGEPSADSAGESIRTTAATS